MTTVLKETETESVLREFLTGAMSPEEFSDWIVSATDDLPKSEQTALWELRLLLTELNEGIRPLKDVELRALSLLAAINATPLSDSESSTTEVKGNTIFHSSAA